MPIQSSFPKVAEQVMTLNKNVVELLTKLNSITTSTDQTINVQVFDENGVLRNFSLPTLSSLKNDIDRLNANIKSMYNIDSTGAMVQTSPGAFKRVVAVDLNREPAAISGLGSVTNFVATNNWFFDSMVNPMLSVEFDLTGQIQDSVRRVQTRRYIVDFEKDSVGNFTANGQSALNSFNNTFRGVSTISITDFENWHRTTPGVLNGQNPKIDDQMFELEPNVLKSQGEFSVLRAQEDRVNRKLWYYLDTLNYLNNETGLIEKLDVGMELILNVNQSTTRYRILEISTIDTSPKVRFERVEGMDPVPIGTGTMKAYSSVIQNKKVRVSVGYDERNVIFMKAIDNDSHILSNDWSVGTGFWSNDLRLSSTTTANGTTMEQFYIDFVYDYGTALKDMVVKKIPNALGGTPIAPTLVNSNFQVVQINKHLTDTPDSNLLKQKHNYQETLKSEIRQLESAILNRNKKAKVEKGKSESEKRQAQLEIDDLSKRKDSKSKLLSTVTQEILDLSKNPMNKVNPKFSVRGFWTIPDPVIVKGSKSQEIVQFKIQYKYLSKDGKESPIQTYSIDNSQTTGALSNWVEMTTPAKRRIFNPATGGYSWEMQDVTNAEMPNINQLDIPIQPNEKIQFRIKSISEVGWPESPVESDWSQIVEVDFPTELNNVLNEGETIKTQANKEDLKNSVLSDLTAKGLDEHLSETTLVGNKTYMHDSSSILSGFFDANTGSATSLFEYLKSIEDRMKSLEEKILRVKGELKVVIQRKNSDGTVDEIQISNGAAQTFEVNCEDYCQAYEETGVESYRVYANNIYSIRDFTILIKNVSKDSPLGLISQRTYSNGDIYSSSLPQVFWVDDKDNLITVDSSGQTKTQMDNQYLWSVNFESSASNQQSRVSDNIGNNFTAGNSLVKVLSNSTYNLGYAVSQKLSFKGENKSLTEQTKWINPDGGIESTTQFLTTVHPVVQNLEDLVENNAEKVRTVSANTDISIPIKIYFKLNAQDNKQPGEGFTYVSLNRLNQTVQHQKKIVMLLENEAESRSFRFIVQFTLKRNRIINTKTGNYPGYTVTNKKI